MVFNIPYIIIYLFNNIKTSYNSRSVFTLNGGKMNQTQKDKKTLEDERFWVFTMCFTSIVTIWVSFFLRYELKERISHTVTLVMFFIIYLIYQYHKKPRK